MIINLSEAKEHLVEQTNCFYNEFFKQLQFIGAFKIISIFMAYKITIG